jgi:hypothetical protein
VDWKKRQQKSSNCHNFLTKCYFAVKFAHCNQNDNSIFCWKFQQNRSSISGTSRTPEIFDKSMTRLKKKILDKNWSEAFWLNFSFIFYSVWNFFELFLSQNIKYQHFVSFFKRIPYDRVESCILLKRSSVWVLLVNIMMKKRL